MDIYAPSNTTAFSKLPVFFFIQGGGFNANSNPVCVLSRSIPGSCLRHLLTLCLLFPELQWLWLDLC